MFCTFIKVTVSTVLKLSEKWTEFVFKRDIFVQFKHIL